eukprot:TRINITY_DN1197_c0_g1_i1.p1 TRINITY_DN1197_c0_g1~~TRINITY_DN1197_c0_g1_i1.p1  ORF type:complete len:452 (+),score=113.63 TRINITY_DN1197_c0_g1_i1:65-1357(+)
MMYGGCLAVVLLSLCVAAFAALDAQGFEDYTGFMLVRTTLQTQEHVDLVDNLGLDVWSDSSMAHIGDMDIMMTKDDLLAMMDSGISVRVINHDVGALVRNERARIQSSPAGIRHTPSLVGAHASSFYAEYHPSSAIFTYLQTLAASFPRLVRYITTIGTTIQGRPIPALVITGPIQNPNKKKIFIQGLQHAREWISPAVVTYIAENLATQYATDPEVAALLDNTEFHFIPLLNVDGYNFTWTSTRLWRKNRRLNTGSTYGVDLNRNWDGVNWCEYGASKTPSSDTYCGTAPFSEPETTASSGYFRNNGPFVGAVDYHSYSQLVLRPFGYGQVTPPDEADLKAVGDEYAAIILRQTQVKYISQPGWQLYLTTGGVRDWWKGYMGIKLAYTVELRPAEGASNGFVLPPDQIAPTAQENWAAFKYFAKQAISA